MMAQLRPFENGLSPSFKYLFGMDREADGYAGFAIENLKEMVAERATELALGPGLGGQFNAAVASLALWTDDIRLFHGRVELPHPRP
jgi:hypothetical protein